MTIWAVDSRADLEMVVAEATPGGEKLLLLGMLGCRILGGEDKVRYF